MMSQLVAVVVALFLGLSAHLTADAQPPKTPPTIGCILPGPLAPRMYQWDAFRQGLRELGYVEGQNIRLEFRAPEREGDPSDGLAAELVRLKVDVLVAATDPVVQAAHRATETIPIVMISGQDPVGRGLVASLARPGGNITGLSIATIDLAPKRLQLLTEIAPRVRRVAVLWNPEMGALGARQFQQLETAVRAQKLELLSLEVRSAEDVEKAFETATRQRADGIVNNAGALGFGLRTRIAQLAVKARLPSVAAVRAYAEAGTLVSYGPSDAEGYRRAAIYIDKILKGTKPADMPIEEPTKFYLAINLKTAKSLGLPIPRSLLLRADHLIE